MNIEEIVEYLKHHIPIIIKDDKGWTIDLNFTDIREKYKED